MCGIVGLFAKSCDVEEHLGEHLAAMLVQMSSRGPDSAGVAVYRDPAPSGWSKLTLYSANPHEHWGAVMDGLRDAFGGGGGGLGGGAGAFRPPRGGGGRGPRPRPTPPVGGGGPAGADPEAWLARIDGSS